VSAPRDPDRERDDAPVLPDTTADERDVDWGDERESEQRDEEWYRRERPPHHE
jgi:hypothetical protein